MNKHLSFSLSLLPFVCSKIKIKFFSAAVVVVAFVIIREILLCDTLVTCVLTVGFYRSASNRMVDIEQKTGGKVDTKHNLRFTFFPFFLSKSTNKMILFAFFMSLAFKRVYKLNNARWKHRISFLPHSHWKSFYAQAGLLSININIRDRNIQWNIWESQDFLWNNKTICIQCYLVIV